MPELHSANLGIAASAGLDSTLLIHLAKELGLRFSICHVNFGLRGTDSDGDQDFLEELSSSLEVSFYVLRSNASSYADENGISIQMAARDLRYAYFEQLIEEGKIDYLLTAHHLNDQLETLLINLSRGTGIRGLSGIPYANRLIRRPFLDFTKDEILKAARDLGISWREDVSNTESKYLRNELRNNVIPRLLEAAPNLITSLNSTFKNIEDSVELIDNEIARFRESAIKNTTDGFTISIDDLHTTNQPVYFLYELTRSYGFNSNDLDSLIKAQSGKELMAGDFRLLKNRNEIQFYKKQEGFDDLVIEEAGVYDYSNGKIIIHKEPIKNQREFVNLNSDQSTLLLDANKIKFPFILRSWREGDRMRPFGLNGSKLISDLLIDKKVSIADKKKAMVLVNQDNILWLIGYRHGKTATIDSTSRQAYVIRFTE